MERYMQRVLITKENKERERERERERVGVKVEKDSKGTCKQHL